MREQFNGLNQAVSALAKHKCANSELHKARNQTCKMLRHLQIATALERHFTSVGIEHWLEKVRLNMAFLATDVKGDLDSNGTLEHGARNYEVWSEIDGYSDGASRHGPSLSENTDAVRAGTAMGCQTDANLVREFFIGEHEVAVQTELPETLLDRV